MSVDLATRIPAQLPEAVEQALVNGNLAQLSPEQRVSLYYEVCASLHLNPLTVPFQYITLNGKLVLYALKSCTDQLRFIHNVNVEIVSRERLDDIYVVTTRARLPNGRQDEEIGAVPISGLKGELLANALMKASTKAKRRVTLAIVGLSMLDETEIETIRDARQASYQVVVDQDTGEITERPAIAAADGQAQLSPGELREALNDRYAELWDQARTRNITLPQELHRAGPIGNWTLQQLRSTCQELKALIRKHDAEAGE